MAWATEEGVLLVGGDLRHVAVQYNMYSVQYNMCSVQYNTVLSGVSRREKTTELVYWDGTGSEKGEKLKYPSQ